MTRAVAAIDRFTWKGAGFDGWMFGICRHVVLDAQRALGRQQGGGVPERAALDADPVDDVLHAEEADAVRAAFARLDPDDRELLELRVVAGLSSDDTAAVLGKRAGAVRMAQSRALQRLRKLMEESP